MIRLDYDVIRACIICAVRPESRSAINLTASSSILFLCPVACSFAIRSRAEMADDSSGQPSISPELARSASAAPSFRLRTHSLNSLRLRRVFDIFDRNRDGEITVAEISLALDRLGLEADSGELASAVASYVRPGCSGLEFEDFVAFHGALGQALIGGIGDEEQEEDEEENDMIEAFAVFDENGDGYISAAELQAVLQKLGLNEGRSLDGVQRMISAVDADHDGRVDFSEFKNMMRNIELPVS